MFARMSSALVAAWVLLAQPALALGDAGAPAVPETPSWNLHGQFTTDTQFHPAFTSPYQGANSLDAGNSGRQTSDLTVFAGWRPWQGAGVYVNPEIDQGYGLSGTLGVAGFPSGEAYKVGARNPYFRLPRAYLRQVWATDPQSGDTAVADGANQLAARIPDDNLTVTAGKFSVVDIFDANRYAHDPKADFQNWALIDAGAFDYAADAWGFTYGAALEWTRAWWTLRGGALPCPRFPTPRISMASFSSFR